MTQSRTLRSLIKSGAAGDTSEFRRAAADLIREERDKRHHLLANDLEGLLEGHPAAPPRGAPPAAPRHGYDLPKDRERGLTLIEMRHARRDLGDVVLADDGRAVIDQVSV